MSRRFRLVDVFGERPLSGNPLAVVIDAQDMATADMLKITRWLGFSETTFLLPPTTEDADYAVRIFTLAGELPFAGHPTLGTCHVWQSTYGADRAEIVQECGAGLVHLRHDGDKYAFGAPPQVRSGPIEPETLEIMMAVLGIVPSDVVASRWVDNGPGWAGLLLQSAKLVLGLRPDFRRGDGRNLDIGVVGFHPDNASARYEVRAFFSDQHGGLLEDPVTGSLNASVAQWLIEEGRVEAPFVAAQGTALGRSGRVQVSTDHDGSVWVGGRVFDIVSGEM